MRGLGVSNFLSLIWKLNNPYYHTLQQCAWRISSHSHHKGSRLHICCHTILAQTLSQIRNLPSLPYWMPCLADFLGLIDFTRLNDKFYKVCKRMGYKESAVSGSSHIWVQVIHCCHTIQVIHCCHIILAQTLSQTFGLIDFTRLNDVLLFTVCTPA